MSLFQEKVRFFLFIAALWALGSCSVRERQNVFDPKSDIDSLDFSLRLNRADSLIRFSWQPPGHIEYSGFHIYRKLQGEKAFKSRAVVTSDQNTFTDTTVSFNLKHSYYLRLIGRSSESPPTRVLSTIPGPGKIWILDRWDEYFYKYAYDLNHKYLTHYAIWIPQDLALNRDGQQLLVTYPLFHYVELIDSRNGQFLDGLEDLKYPYACAYHVQQNAFWVSDSSGALFFLPADNLQSLKLIDDALEKPLIIVIDVSGTVYVLDIGLNQIVGYDKNGARLTTIEGYGQLTFLSSNRQGNELYFISRKSDSSFVYRYSPLTRKRQLIYRGSDIDLVRQSALDQSLWLAQNSDDGARILQLSDAGVRLNTLSGFKKIEDLAVNPYNGNIVIADRALHQVIHLTVQGQVIGRIKDAPFPFRIKIE